MKTIMKVKFIVWTLCFILLNVFGENIGISAPSQLRLIRATYTKITIAWDTPVASNLQLAGYRVFRDGQEIATVSQSEFKDENLESGTTYRYKVVAVTAGGAVSPASVELSISTIKSVPFDNNEQVEAVVDALHDTPTANLSAMALLGAVKAGFEALTGSNISFSVLDGDLISDLLTEELGVISGIIPQMTDAERIAAQAELDKIMKENFSDNSFEHMYINSQLQELAERHWNAGRSTAANILYEASLKFLSNDEQTVSNTLFRLANFRKSVLTVDSSCEEIAARLAEAQEQSLRFFDFFPTSTSIAARSAYLAPANWFFRYFTKMLEYDNYHQEFYESALYLAQKAVELEPQSKIAEKIAAWELIQQQITFRDENGKPRRGTLKITNVTADTEQNFIFPGEPFTEERIFAVTDGTVTVPVYAGHIYNVEVCFEVDGGKALVYSLPGFRHDKGKHYTYSYLNESMESAETPEKCSADFIISHPNYPYNLKVERGIDFFTLYWDWVNSETFAAKYFKVFRGNLPIATVNSNKATRLALTPATGDYVYTVVAYDEADRPSRRSMPITVVPGDQTPYSDFLEWMQHYFKEGSSFSCDDPDGDGVDNYHEFLNGTDPTKVPGPMPYAGPRGFTRLTLKWDSVPEASVNAVYEISRNDEIIASISELEYTDSELTPGLSYRYRIRLTESNGRGTDWSEPVVLQTQREIRYENHEKVRQVVDQFLKLNLAEYTGTNLVSAVKSALEALLGTNITFTVIDRELLDDLVEEELALIREVTPSLGAAEQLALRNELDKMMEEEWAGNSFEEMYIHSKLGELAEEHWQKYLQDKTQITHRDAAVTLYSFSLNFLNNHESSVYNVLNRLAMFQLQGLAEEVTDQELMAAVNNARDIYLQFFHYFSKSSDVRFEINPYRPALIAYWKNFPRLLKYDSYQTEFYKNAEQLAQSWLEWGYGDSSNRMARQIRAWELVPLKISTGGSTGRLEIRNVSTRLPYNILPSDDFATSDIREFQLTGADLNIPVYAGHLYEIAIYTTVSGGPEWKQLIDNVSFDNGKKLIFESGNEGEWSDLSEGTGGAELELSLNRPLFPYNLRATTLPDVFDLSWDYTPFNDEKITSYNIYRGNTLIGNSVEKVFKNIPRQVAADGVYAYTVAAVNTSGVEGQRSPALRVLPEFTPEELKYFEWKQLYFGDKPSLATDDPDGDGLTNYQEFLLGSDPTMAPQTDPKGSIQNITRGAKINYYAGAFSQLPDFSQLKPYKTGIITRLEQNTTAGVVLESERNDALGILITGYFDIEIPGSYRFYMLNDDGARLYIDNAMVLNHNRTGQSEAYVDIPLNKGTHSLRLEYFEHSDNAVLRVSWAGPDFARRVISHELWHTTDDERVLAEVAAWQRDSDFDGLRDIEERRLGTDPFNADTDGDGLTDYEEVHVYLTNPLVVDTDGDGINDYEEVKITFSNPLVVDFDGTHEILQTINGSNYSSADSGWRKVGNYAYCGSRNGTISYAVTIPEQGIYALEVTGGNEQSFAANTDFDLSVLVNGISSGNQILKAQDRASSTVRFYLPELKAGKAIVKLLWSNVESNKMLRIDSVRLVRLGGPDTDGNGRPDWADTRLRNTSGVVISAESATSPLCIEGDGSEYCGMVDITVRAVKEGRNFRPWFDAEKRVVWKAEDTPAIELVELTPFVASVGNGARNTWYADVPLSPDTPTTVTVQRDENSEAAIQTVTWTPTDVLRQQSIMIRKGDALLLSANPGDGTRGMGTITVNDEQLTVNGSSAVPYRFDEAGTISITAEFVPEAGGPSINGELEVKVIEASFTGVPYSIVGLERNWNNAKIPPEAILEYDDIVTIYRSDREQGANLSFYGKQPGYAWIVARLGENGPILSTTQISVLDSSTHKSDGYYKVIDVFNDGSKLIEGKIVLTEVPPDLRIQLVISTAGTTFLDGTIVKWLTAADFDENGVCRYQMLKSSESPTSTCHSMNYYQGNDFLFSYQNW